ncbi:MAG: GNAT family N-acetyltransferase [Deltaproteobacteria bacterium]|nr:GNAT family N-acetyltransferase [Deltaproteobacteria bacterium]
MDKNPEIELRFSRADDSAFIRELSIAAFSPFGDYADVVPGWHISDKSITMVACSNKTPLGFAMVSKSSGRYDQNNPGELLAIAVRDSWQRKGIGRLLLKSIENVALRAGIMTLFLHTATDNRNARKLFSDSGYRIWQIKKGFYAMGQDALVMAKKLFTEA